MKVSMKAVTKTYKLISDTEGLAEVVIRQMTTGDHARRAKMTEEQTFESGGGLTVRWNGPEIRRNDAYMTLVGAVNIDTEKDGEVVPLFRFKDGKNGPELAMSQNEFNKAWDALPVEVSDEIYGHITDMNPDLLVQSGE